MSVRGVKQLQNLLIRYSDLDGSSKGIREWIRGTLIPFATANPELKIRTELKRAKHPFVRGEYVNGNWKTIGIKNMSVEEINGYVMDLRNQIGRKVLQRKTLIEVPHFKPVNDQGNPSNSLQGEWHERHGLIGLDFEIVHFYETPTVESVDASSKQEDLIAN